MKVYLHHLSPLTELSKSTYPRKAHLYPMKVDLPFESLLGPDESRFALTTPTYFHESRPVLRQATHFVEVSSLHERPCTHERVSAFLMKVCLTRKRLSAQYSYYGPTAGPLSGDCKPLAGSHAPARPILIVLSF